MMRITNLCIVRDYTQISLSLYGKSQFFVYSERLCTRLSLSLYDESHYFVYGERLYTNLFLIIGWRRPIGCLIS